MNHETTPVRIWDLPTRLFHGVLAGCVLASLVSAWLGGSAMAWHFRLGHAVLALLVFRCLWGMIGGRWSRFASFVYAPSTTLRYLRGQGPAQEHLDAGHSPLGALSVFALLAVLALQVTTGLFADDEVANTGPLVSQVAEATSAALTRWHRGIGQWLVIGLISLHVLAILYYLLRRRRNLILPMLTGDKRLHPTTPASVDSTSTRIAALLLFAACAGLAFWIAGLGA